MSNDKNNNDCMAKKKLVRSANRMLAGVCGGIADYLDIDPTVVRVIYAALTIFTTGFPGILLYLVLLLIIPARTKNDDYEEAEVVK
jgi:phage shock protein C